MEFVKKIILISLLVMSLSGVAFAGEVHAGFEAGADYTMVSTVTIFTNTYETGRVYYDFMIPVEYRFSDRISLASGFHWAARASHYSKTLDQAASAGGVTAYTIDDYMRVRHYLEFPLTLRVYFPFMSLDVFLGAGGFIGVYVGVLQYGKVATPTNDNLLETTSDFTPPEAGNNTFSAGLLGEIGVSWDLGPGDIYLVGRYSYSLTGLMKAEKDSVNVYHSNLTLSAGYTWMLDGGAGEGGEK